MEDSLASRPSQNLAFVLVFALAAGYGAHLFVGGGNVSACALQGAIPTEDMQTERESRLVDCVRDGMNRCRTSILKSTEPLQ